MSAAIRPPLVWHNRQRTVSGREMNLAAAAAIVERARPHVLAAQLCASVLGALEEISVVLVSDRRIAALHAEFMDDPSPTDVITFQHGEIVASAETARREAARRGLALPVEVARYVVHGLLHLGGWTDTDPDAAADMRAIQENILRRAARALC